MNIGVVAEQSGLNAKTIRYYEEIGLITPMRKQNGYRDYSPDDLHRLTFVQRARSLGFSIEECRVLLSLYDDRSRASADVKRMAQNKIADIDSKIDELHALRKTLSHLSEQCRGDNRPECPIIEGLSGN